MIKILNKLYPGKENYKKRNAIYRRSIIMNMKKDLKTTKDYHVVNICEKFDIYKSVMEKELPGGVYPYSNLTPWTNYHVEGPIKPEDLDFNKWYNEKWLPKTMKDDHVAKICKKFDFYKSEIEKEFPGKDYPYRNLTPWTNYYVEGPIKPEDLDFEKWFDKKWFPMKWIDESIKASRERDANTIKFLGNPLRDWLIIMGILGVLCTIGTMM